MTHGNLIQFVVQFRCSDYWWEKRVQEIFNTRQQRIATHVQSINPLALYSNIHQEYSCILSRSTYAKWRHGRLQTESKHQKGKTCVKPRHLARCLQPSRPQLLSYETPVYGRCILDSSLASRLASSCLLWHVWISPLRNRVRLPCPTDTVRILDKIRSVSGVLSC